METVALLYEDYQKELAEDFKNTFLKRASDTDSSRSNDTVIDEVTDMLSTNIAVYTEKLLQRWGFSSGGEGGGGGDVTVTLDDLLKKYLEDNYVTIKGDQEVFGEKDFRKGIRIAGRRLYWDEGNDALVIEGAAYTTRWLSAYGMSPGGGGAGSGGAAAMYQLIDVSPNDTKDAVLGAEKDYVLTFDGSFWRGMPNKGGLSSKLFTALDKEGNEVNPDDENAEIYAIRANYSLWSVGFLSAKGISDGGTGGGGGGAVALYQLLDVEKNADITGVAGATKGSVLTFNGDKWYADKPKTAAGISNLFTALDNDGNEVDLNDESKLGTITNIRANYALWSVDWISAKGKSSGGSGGGGGLINLVYGFESLGGTFDNNDNSATFNAFTINEIWKLASSGLTNVTVTGSGNAVTDVIKGSDGRSLTFTKGSTFATKSEFDALNTKFNDFLTGSDADDIINKWSELEVFLQGMKESDNLAVILQSKMDKTAFSKLFTALDASGNEVDPSDDTKTIASIRANFGFWGVDYISAKGVSKGSGGTGGASTLYQLVDVLANDTEDGVEGAAAGKALVFDGTHWRAGDAGLNESQLYSYLTANKYLTQSAADSRYVTSSRKVIAGTGLSGGGALTSDVTLSLGTSGVVAGTYTKVMVDAYGRVTSGTNLSATDIPNLDWSKITTGKPTTLAGYGITDAYTKTEADGKYVTIATAQTVSGAKTFSATMKTSSVLPSTDANSALGGTANRWSNVYSVNGVFSQNVTAKLLSASESLQIGDAYLKWDAASNAVYVIKKDGTTPVGFYSTDWLSAKGVSISGVQTGTLADLNDVEITNPVNGQALKYDAASKKWVNGTIDSFNVNQMWTELKKADSSKVIDISHIPTSVLDGRWVTISTNQTITGQKTFTQQLKSTVATGTSPFAVDSTTIVKNLNVNFLDGRRADSFTSIIGRHSIYTSGTAPYNYIHLFRIANSEGYSTLRVDIDIKTRYHRALLFIDISTGQYPYGESGTAINISKLQVNSQGASLYYTVTKQASGYNYYDIYYNSGAWNTGSYDVILRGINGALVFEPKNTNMNNLPSGYIEVIKTPLDGDISGNAATATALKNSRTLWGQPFNGTANVSGDMTGVGNITMSGALHIGNATSPNTIYFYGTTGDSPGGYNHTFIAERLWGGTESSELVLFKGNDLGNGNEAVNVSASGPDRIRHIAAAHLFQTYTSPLAGSVEDVCTSSALKSLFGIAANRVTSYVPFMSTVASGTAPFIVASNTVVGNLNADLLDGVHLAGLSGREGVMRSWLRGRYTTVNQYFGNGNVVTIDPKPTDDATLSANTTVLSLGDVPTRNTQLAFHYDTNTIKYRRHDDSKWNDWVVLIHSGNYASYSDGRYVKKAGDTMTGDLNISGGHILYMLQTSPTSTQQIHLQGGSNDYGRIAFGATAENAGWMEIASSDDGNEPIYARQYTGVFTTIKRTATLLDASGNTSFPGSVTSVRHISTVGTGTQPYQCNSTTLNTNLNADLLDNWHIMDIPRNYNSTATYSLQFALGSTDNNWKKIFACSESGTGPWRSVTVWGQIWYAYGNHAQEEVRNYHFCAIFQMRSGETSSGSGVGSVVNSARLYLPTFAKGMDNIRLVRVGTNNFELQVRQIGSYHNGHIQYQYWANGANVSAWENLQSTSNTSVAVSAGGASTLADSRASSADVWTSARTFYIQDHNAAYTGTGISVNGSSNVYLKLPSSIQCSDWFRSTGNSGWYHQNYGGGIYMEDSTYVRVFGGKRFYVGNTENTDFSTNTAISTDGGIYAKKNITSSANIFANGAITAKASSSDIRLKTDIQGYDAMGIIRKFRSVKYHWNAIAKENSEVFNHDNWNYGLIAQDLLSGGYTQWVKDIFNDYYTIDYERLIPVVWKGLQEVDDEVTKLKKEVARLNKRVKELEKSLCA